MKRRAAWSILPVLSGIVLYGLKYRLDHPPLSRADKAFDAMVKQSDDVRLVYTYNTVAQNYGDKSYQWQYTSSCIGNELSKLKDLVRPVNNPTFHNLISGEYALRLHT